MPATIDYFFGPQSPWSFLGHERFAALVARSKAEVRVIPCDLLHVFNASGGLPLAKRPPQRQAYRMMELKRWRAQLNQELNLEPRFFPVDANPAALLTIAAIREAGTDAGMRLTGTIMRACWVEEKNIADGETLAALADAAGLDGRALLAQSKSPDILAAYDGNNQEAIAAQVFGAPTYIYQGELFWGQDRLDFLERALAGPARNI